MGVAREIKRRTKAMTAPTVFLLVTGYFGWQATQGERGLETYALRQGQLRSAEQELGRALDEQHAWERRDAALHTGRLDLDMLDERARAMLNLVEPTDIVVSYPPNKRLF